MSYFIAPDAFGDLALWRGLSDDPCPEPVIFQYELRHDPEVWDALVRFVRFTEGDPVVTPQRHHYLSTACHHGKHDACRQVCKFCESACECSCHTPTTEEQR